MNIYIKDIVNVCNAKLICGNLDLECSGFSKDTRTIEKGDIYVAIRGEKFDGNKYYEEAFSKGASACILDNLDLDGLDLDKYKDKTILLVDNTIDCLQKMASYKRSLYNINVIAVTGSVGKTSTKDIISNVLKQKYKVLKTEGNNNNHIGLPLTILKLKDHEVLVVEMGMNHFDEIKLLSKIARPNIAVITNIGTSHVGNLGSRENILKAKLEILEGLEKDKILIVNNDNDLLHDIKLSDDINLITVGISNEGNYMANHINLKESMLEFNINDNNENVEIKLNLDALAFVYNSLIAYAIGKLLEVSVDDIKKGIETVELSNNRLKKIVTNAGYIIIDDSYNASYDSMKLAIEVLSRVNKKRKIAVLGDMLELGEFTKEMHEKVAEDIINNNIDVVVTIGNYSNYINNKLISLSFDNNNLYHFNTEKDTYSFFDGYLNKDDVVLFKSSHSIGLTNIVNYLNRI